MKTKSATIAFSLLLLPFSLLSLFFLFISCCGVIFSLVDQKTSHSGFIPVKWLQFSLSRFSQIQLIIYGLLHLEKHSNTNPFRFVNFVLFTRDRILTNETQSKCFIPLSYSLIYIGCVKSYSAKFVRNHFLIRYFLHCDWLLPSTDLKGHSRLR